MSTYNYMMCKRAFGFAPTQTQGAYQPYQNSNNQAASIATAWDRAMPPPPAPQPQPAAAAGGNNNYMNGMLTGGLVGTVATLGGGYAYLNNKLKDIGGVKGATKLYKSFDGLSDENKQWLQQQMQGGDGDLNTKLNKLRYAQAHPVKAFFGFGPDDDDGKQNTPKHHPSR